MNCHQKKWIYVSALNLSLVFFFYAYWWANSLWPLHELTIVYSPYCNLAVLISIIMQPVNNASLTFEFNFESIFQKYSLCYAELIRGEQIWTDRIAPLRRGRHNTSIWVFEFSVWPYPPFYGDLFDDNVTTGPHFYCSKTG